MKKRICLISTSLLLSSCQATPSLITTLPEDQRSNANASLNQQQLRIISDRLTSLKYSTQSKIKDHKHAYKGIPHHKHIDEYTESELDRAIPNELSALITDEKNRELTAIKLNKLGYQVRPIGKDTLVIKLPESGTLSLKKHFRVLDKLSELAVVTPRIPGELYATHPSDPMYSAGSQWELAAINAATAWDYPDIRNSREIIAIVDTGLRNTHEDISSSYVAGRDCNPTEVNWLGQTHNGYGMDTWDYFGHGTIVAGIAGAIANNGKGMAGSGWAPRIMPMVINDPRTAETIHADAARAAVIWAIDNGAKVINCSFNSGDNWWTADLAQYAQDRNIPLICGTGNDFDVSNGFNPSMGFPAAYSNPNIISVGASTQADQRAYFSKYLSSKNNQNMDLMAPGTIDGSIGVLSTGTSSDADYNKDWRGTSMAAPYVAGAFSSLWYACRALPYWQVRDVLFATAKDISAPGWDQETGHGVLNFGAAANYLLGSAVCYQFLDPATGIHAYTTSPADKIEPNYEGIAFRLHPAGIPGTTAFYRKYHPSSGERLLTTASWEGDEVGWILEGPIGAIATSVGSAPGMTQPLYRLMKPGQGFYYTTGASWRDHLITNGWTYQGVSGYVYP